MPSFRTLSLFSAMLFTLAVSGLSAPKPAHALSEQQELVEQAALTVKKFRSDSSMSAINYLIENARAVLVYPSIIKGGLILGGEGGNGVLMSRTKDGKWLGPAFYTMGQASWGLQIGIENTEIIFIFMNDKGLNRLLKSQLKIGGDLSVAAGPAGAGFEASSQNTLQDVYYYARSKGLFGGITIEGGVVAINDGWNEAYYGKPVKPVDILIKGTVFKADAESLRKALAAR